MLIEADELRDLLYGARPADRPLRVFDATITDDAYLVGHIPGAAYFDHARVSDPAGKYEFTISPDALLIEQIGDLGIANDSEVVLYACGMLPYAARAWWVLRHAGHERVRVLDGGLAAWQAAGGEIETEVQAYPPTHFEGRVRPGMFATRQDVREALGTPGVATINAMPLESHEASHITGSACLPCTDLMRGMDGFLPDDELASRLGDLGQNERIVTYCGGGIAATINAMAHLMVGHENVAVYDGSLYEWLGEGLPSTGDGEWEIWKQG